MRDEGGNFVRSIFHIASEFGDVGGEGSDGILEITKGGHDFRLLRSERLQFREQQIDLALDPAELLPIGPGEHPELFLRGTQLVEYEIVDDAVSEGADVAFAAKRRLNHRFDLREKTA